MDTLDFDDIKVHYYYFRYADYIANVCFNKEPT